MTGKSDENVFEHTARMMDAILGPNGPLRAGYERLRYLMDQREPDLAQIAALKSWLAVGYTYIEMGLPPGSELDVAALIVVSNINTGSEAEVLAKLDARINEFQAAADAQHAMRS